MLDEQQKLRNASALSKDEELPSSHNPLAPHLEAVVSWAKERGIGTEDAKSFTFTQAAEYFLEYKDQIKADLAKALAEQNAKAAPASTTNTKLVELLASDKIVLPSNMEFTEALQVLDNQAVHEGRFGYLNNPLPPAKGFVSTKSKKSK